MLTASCIADPDAYIIPVGPGSAYADRNTNTSLSLVVYTSSQSNLTIEWYFNGSIINTVDNARYSVGTDVLATGIPVHVLNIANVDEDVMGEYVAVVFVDGRNLSDSIQLKPYCNKAIRL